MELNKESGRHSEENGDDLPLTKRQASGDIWGNNVRRNIRKIGRFGIRSDELVTKIECQIRHE
jgi:hypothetical protein